MESGSDDDDPAIDPDHGLALVKAEAEDTDMALYIHVFLVICLSFMSS